MPARARRRRDHRRAGPVVPQVRPAAAGVPDDGVVAVRRDRDRSTGARAFAPGPSSPLCACSDPQHGCDPGVSTSQPLASTTSAVSRLMSGKTRSCTQPVSSATRPRGSRRLAAISADRELRGDDRRLRLEPAKVRWKSSGQADRRARPPGRSADRAAASPAARAAPGRMRGSSASARARSRRFALGVDVRLLECRCERSRTARRSSRRPGTRSGRPEHPRQ